MRILIVEDAEFMALALQSVLSEQGHQVDWVIGVRSFQPFIGINEKKQDIAIDPTVYELAFVDGQTFGPHEGPAIVEALVARNVTCVGVSSTPEYNNKMTSNGAIAGFLKVVAFAAIVEQVLAPDVVRQMTPELVEAVNAFAQRIREDKDLRRKLDGIIEKFLPH